MTQSIKKLIIVLVATVITALTVNVQAATDPLTFYRIGGAKSRHVEDYYGLSETIGGSVDVRFNYSCGKFDLFENLEQLLDGFKNAGDQFILLASAAAQAVVDSLPLYILYQIDPVLAQRVVTTINRYEELYRLAIKKCQQYESDILAGKDPYSNWYNLARRITWRDQAEEGATATEAEIAADTQGGSVAWVDGERRGGEGMEPIRVYTDIAVRGYYNIAGDGGRVREVFESDEAVRTWVKEVLGDIEIYTHPNAVPTNTPGIGLQERLRVLTEETDLILRGMVEGGEITEDNLVLISTPTNTVTAELINGIRRFEPDAQALYTDRIVNDLVVARVAAELDYVRRMFITGALEPNVYGTPAYEIVHKEVIPEIDREVDLLRFGMQMNAQFVSNTANIILEKRYNRNAVIAPGESPAENALREGAANFQGSGAVVQ